MMEMCVRFGHPDDAPRLFRLDRLCFNEHFRFDLATMSRYLAYPSNRTLVAEVACELAGFLIVEMRPGEAYLITLDVHPRWRRQGVAKRLLEDAETQAAAAGCKSLDLHVWEANRTARKFYEALGYRELESHLDYYGSGRHARVLVKTLAQADRH